MRGLLEKDFRLLLQRKRMYLIFFFIMIIMSVSNGGLFVISYGTLLFGIFTIGTQSYDDYENSVPFLLTLPITRKEYVREKFLFCGSGVFIGWMLSLLIGSTAEKIMGTSLTFLGEWKECILLLFLFVTFITIMIPLQIKYNVERSRIAVAILGGAVFAIATFGSFLQDKIGMNLTFMKNIFTISNEIILCALILSSLVVIYLMYIWSLKVMEKKEY